ncbi:MAG: hypothetical protein R6X14_10045 [bacterium]
MSNGFLRSWWPVVIILIAGLLFYTLLSGQCGPGRGGVPAPGSRPPS